MIPTPALCERAGVSDHLEPTVADVYNDGYLTLLIEDKYAC
jgi:hypothetical protein